MLVPKIAGFTPGEIDSVNLITDLTEEEYFGFAGMQIQHGNPHPPALFTNYTPSPHKCISLLPEAG